MQARSNVFTDKFIAWALETVGSGTHGDVVRSLAGAKGAAGQIEYVRQFGSSNPEVSRAGSSPGSGSETTEGEEKQRAEGSDL